eukprot:13985781-Alexandrium_andersonii.AAC.1
MPVQYGPRCGPQRTLATAPVAHVDGASGSAAALRVPPRRWSLSDLRPGESSGSEATPPRWDLSPD